LHRSYDTSSPWNAATVPAGFSTYPRAGVPGDSCSPNGAAITLPAGNWYVNCPSGFSVSNNFTIGAGNVVFAGGVNVQGSSLTIGSTANSTTIVYIRSGNLSKAAQAALTLNNTTVLLQSGAHARQLELHEGQVNRRCHANIDEQHLRPAGCPQQLA